LWPLVRLLAGAGILAGLVWRLGGDAFLDGLRLVDGGTMVAALAVGGLTTVLSGWRWCLVARGLGLRLPLGQAVADYYRSLFLNAALPGGVLGDVHRAVRHGRDAGDVARGVRAVVLERSAGQVFLVAVGLVVLVLAPVPVFGVTGDLLSVAGAALVAVAAAVAGWTWWRGRRPARVVGRVRRAVGTALSDVRVGLFAGGRWPLVVASSAAILAGHLSMFLLAARVAGAAVPLTRLLPLAVLALFAMALPLNVGGWGPREGVSAWAFAAAGLGAGRGLTTAVVYGVLAFVAALPGAAVLVGRWWTGLRPHRPQIELEQRVLAQVGAAHRGA
jgi:uncharacterized membrane protein YbhN (UPF0104 family)